MLQELMKSGGNPDVFYKARNTPLTELNIQTKDSQPCDVLQYVRIWDNTQITAYNSTLVKANSSIFAVWSHLLIAALENSREEIIENLIKTGVNVNLTIEAGRFRTPLIAAFSIDSFQTEEFGLAKTLLREGADPNAVIRRDKYGSAFIAAVRTDGFKGIDRLVLIVGAIVTVSTVEALCTAGAVITVREVDDVGKAGAVFTLRTVDTIGVSGAVITVRKVDSVSTTGAP